MERTFTVEVGGRTFTLATGKLAGQAGGAVTVQHGETVILATATVSAKVREGISFFPLTIDFEERLYAAGRIPGGFFKREGRPSEMAILLSRLIDRPLRPLFPEGFRNDTQVIITALSTDQEHPLDMASMLGASAALHISDAPWGGPIAAVRVGYINGQLALNPTNSEQVDSTIDVRVAGTRDDIVMIEAEGHEVSEELVIEAARFAHREMQSLIDLQEEMRAEVGKPKMQWLSFAPSDELKQGVLELVGDRMGPVLDEAASKQDRRSRLAELEKEAAERFGEGNDPQAISAAFEEALKKVVRRRTIDRGRRIDGRKPDELRQVSAEVSLLPRAHGSGLFARGETQVLSIVTLGTVSDAQRLDTLWSEESKRYMHHYTFPPFSTGETWPLRGPRRREIGHGALAERAVYMVVPPEDDFPYTLRVVSEVLSSNGSTSMAAVCGSTLALMDAGVPIKTPVAGISMGLMTDGQDYAVLTDIEGSEDHYGDMDFKVAGTRNGITAIQLDLKIAGLRFDIMQQALERARQARAHILDRMAEAIGAPREELPAHAPRIQIIKINPEKIGAVIGPGGKMIRSIQEETGVKIDIEDDGTVFIAGSDGAGAARALERIRALTIDPEIGHIYTGKVVRTTDFGAFVEILPNKDGLVHISQLADYRVPTVEDVCKVGDELMVMVIGIDPQGKIKLSRQAVLEGWTAEEAQARDRGGRGGPRERGDGGRGDGGRGRGPRRSYS